MNKNDKMMHTENEPASSALQLPPDHGIPRKETLPLRDMGQCILSTKLSPLQSTVQSIEEWEARCDATFNHFFIKFIQEK